MTRSLPVDAERRLLNYERVAAYLGVSLRTAKQLAADGELVKVPLAGKTLFDKVDLDAYIDRVKRSA